MKRKIFLKTLLAGGALSVFDSLNLVNFFIPKREVTLPFIDGMRKVTILQMNKSLIAEVDAQWGWGYLGNSYNNAAMIQAQQWYNYQQAVIAWQQQMMAWQQQQYYAWLQQSHIRQMQILMQQYQNYGQIGPPQAWSAVQSIYGTALGRNRTPVFFGLNNYKQEVAIEQTLPGADKLFSVINQQYGKAEAEKTVGPQSNEQKTLIQLPDASTLSGTAYATNGNSKGGGFVAVSDPNQLVRADNGQTGQLIKYSGPTGIQYGVV